MKYADWVYKYHMRRVFGRGARRHGGKFGLDTFVQNGRRFVCVRVTRRESVAGLYI